jgi:hypothetical protein
VRTKEYAGGWGTLIRLLHELATVKDVKRLNAYCKIDTYNEYLGDDDLDAFESWSHAFQGEHRRLLDKWSGEG